MKKLVLVFVVTFAFSTTAMAVDIAISTQVNWWPQATADREMQDIVDNVTTVSVEVFTPSDLSALASWVRDHTGDGVSDLLILCGQFPATIYPAGNAQPDGSIAELFLDDGNCIINTGDYMFYVGTAGNNEAGGLQNMMDIPTITMWDPAVQVTPTPDGRIYTPSFQGFTPSRPWHLDELEGNWQVELILGQNADGTRADPAIVINTVTGGRLGTFFQVADTDTDLRGEVISEWINNWYLENISDPELAGDPNPENEAVDVPRDVILSWTPGELADKHDVYFGTVFDDVNNASRANPLSVLTSQNQDPNSYAPPQRLEFETTYYWRVDEVNGAPDYTIYKGDVWSFTTEPLAYAIENVSVTASSQAPNKGPENTVNDSGLDSSGLLHGKDADDNMWLSDMMGPQPTWIEYEFDTIYKLHEMWVWNSNDGLELVIGLGLKDVTIEYSTNGTDYATLGTTHEFARAPGLPDYAHNTVVDFGGLTAKYVRLTANSNWGGIFNQYGLSEVRFFHIPVHARNPYPASGATGVPPDVILSWRAGREAVTHDVYVGTDEQAVIDGTAAFTTTAETIHGPLALDLDTTHYWKVNEVNEAETPAVWQGGLWSFTTSDHIVVDDFESYNDLDPADPESKRIFNVWTDGYGVATNGSLVGYENSPFTEQTIVHGGRQSMPFLYSNTGGAAFSQAELTLSPAQDWTVSGVVTLAVHFHGTDGNTGQLYVKINGTKVTYDGQASNLAQAGWQAWNIDLASSGASLQNVTKLAVGIDGAGASGTLYFDDIGLYPYSREFITPSAPDYTRLVGHWKFDGDTQDSSGRGNHGTPGVTPESYVAGKVGSNAMSLRGADYVVIDGVVDDITSTNITLSAWIKTTQRSEGNVFAANTATSSHPLMFGVTGGSPFVNDGSDITFPPPVNDDLWHLITYVRDGDTGYVYVDGILRGTYSASFSLASVTRWSIGQEWDTGPSDFYTGAVDDARIYDYPLSAGEVAWLSGKTEPFDKPF